MSTLSQVHLHDEATAYRFVEPILLPNGPVCPALQETKRVSKLNGKNIRIGVYKVIRTYRARFVDGRFASAKHSGRIDSTKIDGAAEMLGMQHKDFRIGMEFLCGGGRWRCTDVGRRTVIAIALDHDNDPSWYGGPPYAVAEVVLDEHDLEACEPAAAADTRRRG